MLGKPPRDPKTVGSFAELRQHYQTLWGELDECKRQKSAAYSTLKSRSQEARGAQADLKKAKGQIVTLTKKEHAKQKRKAVQPTPVQQPLRSLSSIKWSKAAEVGASGHPYSNMKRLLA